ncbi:MAG TPA: terminase small subunit [Xanthobacteraceae bacterium]
MTDEPKTHPLPDGVDDAVLNRGQLARALDVSEPTLDRWIADGMPVVEGGGNGRPYKFQLSACWAWKCARDDDEMFASEQAERAVQQMRLALIGGSVGDSERALSAKQRAELYEAEYRWMQAAQLRGELAPVKQVAEIIEEVFALIRDAVTALPDRLQRECNLKGREIERAIVACDDALAEAHRRIRDGLSALSAPTRVNGHSLELQ